MNEFEIKRVVTEAVEQAVPNVMTRLGIDMSTPDAVIQTQVDFAYLRRSRKGSEDIRKWVTRSAIGVAASAALYAFWDGITSALRLKIGG